MRHIRPFALGAAERSRRDDGAPHIGGVNDDTRPIDLLGLIDDSSTLLPARRWWAGPVSTSGGFMPVAWWAIAAEGHAWLASGRLLLWRAFHLRQGERRVCGALLRTTGEAAADEFLTAAAERARRPADEGSVPLVAVVEFDKHGAVLGWPDGAAFAEAMAPVLYPGWATTWRYGPHEAPLGSCTCRLPVRAADGTTSEVTIAAQAPGHRSAA